MSIDALNNSVAKLSADVDTLIASTAGTVPQAQVDAAQSAVDAIDAKVVATFPPVIQAAKPE